MDTHPRDVAYRVGYRITGSWTDTRDAVHRAWRKSPGLDDETFEPAPSLVGSLVTASTRACLAQMRSHRDHAQPYSDAWLPQPLVSSLDVRAGVVVRRAHARGMTGDDGVRMPAMVAQHELTIEQRVAYVLRDVVDLPFTDIAQVLGCSEAEAQRHTSQAQRRIAEADPPPRIGLSEQFHIMQSFLTAVRSGDVSAVAATLHPDVVVLAKGGLVVKEWSEDSPFEEAVDGVVTRTSGVDQAARFSLELASDYDPRVLTTTKWVSGPDGVGWGIETGPSLINGDVGMLAPDTDSRDRFGDCDLVRRVTTFAHRHGRIVGIYDIRSDLGYFGSLSYLTSSPNPE